MQENHYFLSPYDALTNFKISVFSNKRMDVIRTNNVENFKILTIDLLTMKTMSGNPKVEVLSGILHRQL